MIFKVACFFVLVSASIGYPGLDKVNNIVFSKLGSIDDGDNSKLFFVANHFRGSWQDGREMCHDYGLEYLSLDTEGEYNKFVQLAANYTVGTNIYAGAMAGESKKNWLWVNSGNEMQYPIKWWPGEPTNLLGFCLMFERSADNQLLAHDVYCSRRFENVKIICQNKQS